MQTPIQLKQQVTKIVVQLSSKVCPGEEPKKRKEQIPQHLRVCGVSSMVLTAGDTTVNERDIALVVMQLIRSLVRRYTIHRNATNNHK